MKDSKGNWKPTRIAYLAKGNGEILTDVVTPTSTGSHGSSVNVAFVGGRRTLRDCLLMMMTEPKDVGFDDASKVYVG